LYHSISGLYGSIFSGQEQAQLLGYMRKALVTYIIPPTWDWPTLSLVLSPLVHQQLRLLDIGWVSGTEHVCKRWTIFASLNGVDSGDAQRAGAYGPDL